MAVLLKRRLERRNGLKERGVIGYGDLYLPNPRRGTGEPLRPQLRISAALKASVVERRRVRGCEKGRC